MGGQLKEKLEARDARMCVVGLGYVGLPLLRLIAGKGFPCIGLDVQERAIRNARDHGLDATDDAAHAVADADVVFICVPTPVDSDHVPDYGPLRSAVAAAGGYMKDDSLLIVESTVSPGATESVVLPELKAAREGRPLPLVAHCPERVDPGNPHWEVHNLPRVLAGIDATSTQAATATYEALLEAPVRPMSTLAAAEAVKMVENAFRDVNIAFVNELALSFDRCGIDLVEVIEGAATKPFGFMPHWPGCGVGGHCIPVDPYYLIDMGKAQGFNHRFLKMAREINDHMPVHAVELLEEELEGVGLPLAGSRIAVLGLAYKPGIADTRESPAWAIIHELTARGATVVPFDPYAQVAEMAADLEAALDDATGAIVVTAHEPFKALPPSAWHAQGVQVVIDGRNCLDAEAFLAQQIRYRGIGRVPERPAARTATHPVQKAE